jgi:hypothetical protein
MKIKKNFFGLTIIVFSFILILYLYIYKSNQRNFDIVKIHCDNYNIYGRQSIGSDQEKWIIFVHGNRKDGNEHPLYTEIIKTFDTNYSILAIDLYGFGLSIAEHESSNHYTWNRMNDIVCAMDYIFDEFQVPSDQLYLIGHSLGAAQVLLASQYFNVKLVIPIGLGNYEPMLANHDSRNSYLNKIQRNTAIQVNEKKFFQDYEQMKFNNLEYLCMENIFFIFAQNETDHVNSFFQKLISFSNKCEYSFYIVPHADHMFGYESSFSNLFYYIFHRFVFLRLMSQLHHVIKDKR